MLPSKICHLLKNTADSEQEKIGRLSSLGVQQRISYERRGKHLQRDSLVWSGRQQLPIGCDMGYTMGLTRTHHTHHL
jgi:hypothetical protein